MPFRWHPDVLDALAGHGLCPRPETEPARVREALSELYRYEIRRLRDKRRTGIIPPSDYIGHVVALRRRYFLLSIPVERWTLPDPDRR